MFRSASNEWCEIFGTTYGFWINEPWRWNNTEKQSYAVAPALHCLKLFEREPNLHKNLCPTRQSNWFCSHICRWLKFECKLMDKTRSGLDIKIQEPKTGHFNMIPFSFSPQCTDGLIYHCQVEHWPQDIWQIIPWFFQMNQNWIKWE